MAKRAKVYIRDKTHLLVEWQAAIKKGFSLEDGSTKIPHFVPESIVYHLAERIITPLQRDYVSTGYGKIHYFEDAQIVQTIKQLRKVRKKNPNKSVIIITRHFEDIKDAIEYIQSCTGKKANLPKVYQAAKYNKKYHQFNINFKRGKFTVKTDNDNQLTLPFVTT